MSKIKRIICILLSTLFVGTCVACDKLPVQGQGGLSTGDADTSIDLVKNGATDYQILLAENATDTENFAASELAYFFEEATGYKIKTVSESTVTADKDDKYLAIGATDIFEESGIALSAAELANDGFKLVTYGNCVLMNALGESGKLYSVYEFLRRQFDYRVYAADEIYVRETENCKLKNFNVTEVPDFEGRDFHNYVLFNDAQLATRLRLNGVRTPFKAYQGNGSAWAGSLWSHTTFKIMPKTEYFNTHRKWYSDDGTQLCFSKPLEDSADGELMFTTFVDNLMAFIEKESTSIYFMIGQEDVGTTCGCDSCVINNEIYGGEGKNPSGTLMVFINKVAREVKKRLLESDTPERADIVKLVIFAYQRTEAPPVTYNPKTGLYESVDEVKAEDNVVVRLAFLGSIYSKNFLDKEYNLRSRQAILGWSSIGAGLSAWNYNISFGSYLYPMYNFHTIQENYQIFKEYGVTDILDQGSRDTGSTPFFALRNYISSELLWNTDLDMNELVQDFMTHYFKDAAPYMLEYYRLVNANYKLMEKKYNYVSYAGESESEKNVDAKYYPKAYLNKVMELFDKAYEAIEKIPDFNLRQLIYNRVTIESLSPRYILLDHYQDYYSLLQRRQMILDYKADAARYQLLHWQEDVQDASKFAVTINQKTDQWLKELS